MSFRIENDYRLINFLLLNAYSCGSPGLAHGKAGISLALFEAARKLKNESLEEHAFELLQEALVYSGKNISFSNGSAGVGWLLLYLIRNHLIEADYLELFEQQQNSIIQTIVSGGYKHRHIMEYTEMLAFLYFSAENISSGDFQKATSVLEEEIKSYYDNLCKKESVWVDMDDFYHCSASVLNTYRDISDKEYWGEKIMEICCLWEQKGVITESVDLGFWLMEYGKNHAYRDKLFSIGEYLAGMALRNVMPQMMSLREKTNVLYYLSQSEIMRKSDDGHKLKKQIKEAWVTSDIDQQEYNIIGSLRHKAFYCGMGQGVARLLLLRVYWEQLMEQRKNLPIGFLFY